MTRTSKTLSDIQAAGSVACTSEMASGSWMPDPFWSSLPPSRFRYHAVSQPSFSSFFAQAADHQPFQLYNIIGHISDCQGCGNKFTRPPTPPNDLCWQHKEWRSFSVDNCPQTKFSPAYCQVSLFCLQNKWPMFHPGMVVITPEISIKLNQVHKDFLLSFRITSFD